MGDVYRARDTRLGRHVALKVVAAGVLGSDEQRRRFRLEARAASALNHPHIVSVYDIGEDDGTDFIAMEVEGQSLARRCGGGMPLGEALGYAAQIADAMARAHAAEIVHRDLKPANVMVTSDGAVKVLDFGIAKHVAPTSGATSTAVNPASEDGRILGTATYMVCAAHGSGDGSAPRPEHPRPAYAQHPRDWRRWRKRGEHRRGQRRDEGSDLVRLPGEHGERVEDATGRRTLTAKSAGRGAACAVIARDHESRTSAPQHLSTQHSALYAPLSHTNCSQLGQAYARRRSATNDTKPPRPVVRHCGPQPACALRLWPLEAAGRWTDRGSLGVRRPGSRREPRHRRAAPSGTTHGRGPYESPTWNARDGSMQSWTPQSLGVTRPSPAVTLRRTVLR